MNKENVQTQRTIVIDLSAALMFVLQIMLIILKLSGTVDWSWFIVLIPFWIAFVFFFTFIAIGAFIGYRVTKDMKEKMNRLQR